MNEGRIGITTFCDDVRQELGNKLSMMGCYGSDVLVSAFPIALPKFCAVVRISTPRSDPFRSLAIRATLDEEVIAVLEFPRAVLETNQASLAVVADSELKRFVFQSVLTLSPLGLPQPSVLRVNAEIDGEASLVGLVRFVLDPRATASKSEDSRPSASEN